jgi:hypothetical protein
MCLRSAFPIGPDPDKDPPEDIFIFYMPRGFFTKSMWSCIKANTSTNLFQPFSDVSDFFVCFYYINYKLDANPGALLEKNRAYLSVTLVIYL